MPEKPLAEKKSFWKRLLSRRVPQITLSYLAASWPMLLFTDWIVKRYALSPYLPDLALTFLLAMIPSVLIVAYFHGLPGRNKWHPAEIFSVSINLLLVAGLAYFLFAGKDLGSTEKKVQVSDETGAIVEKVVAKSQFRKNVALFYFDNRSGSPKNDWLQYAVPTMLEIDLSQDLYIEIKSPGSQDLLGTLYVFKKIKDAGYKTAVGLPLMLMKKIAGEIHRDYFISGGIAAQGTSYQFDFAVYRTRDMKQIAKGQVSGKDLFDTVDQLTLQLKRGLELPSGHLDKTTDLPVGEIFTRSMPAARAFTAGIQAVVLNQEWKKGQEFFEEAVKLDPAFAYANLQLVELYAMSSQSAQWQTVLKTLMQQAYKLPERQQVYVKYGYYTAMQEPEKAMAILNMIAGLYPEDTQVYYQRALLYTARGQFDLALADYQKVQKLDPQNREILKDMAAIHKNKGDYARAEKTLLDYAASSPDDTDALLALGEIKNRQGDHEKARAYYQQAQLLRPDDIGIMIELGNSEFDSGHFAESLAIYEKTEALAISAEDRFKVFNAQEAYFTRRGQMKNALAAFDKKIVDHKKFSMPIMSMIAEMDRAELLVLGGRSAEAYQGLEALQKQMSPPFDKYIAMGFISALLVEKKADAAEQRLEDIQVLIKQMGVTALEPYVLKVQTKVAEIRKNYTKALELCLEVKKQSPGVSIDRDLAVCYRFFKEYDKAEKAIRQALLISPFSAALNREAAELYWEMGKKEEAIAFLKRAEMIWHEADPEYEPARLVKAQLQSWSTGEA